jgi:hypothetical protein
MLIGDSDSGAHSLSLDADATSHQDVKTCTHCSKWRDGVLVAVVWASLHGQHGISVDTLGSWPHKFDFDDLDGAIGEV